jgi:hypothetical protein
MKEIINAGDIGEGAVHRRPPAQPGIVSKKTFNVAWDLAPARIFSILLHLLDELPRVSVFPAREQSRDRGIEDVDDECT